MVTLITKNKVRIMKKNRILIILVIVILCTLVLSACRDTTVKIGKYYLKGSDSVYVEILPNNKIRFVGIDFSATIEDLNSTPGPKVSQSDFEGIKDYIFDTDQMLIRVIISGDGTTGTYISLDYSNERLTRRNQEYILKVENS